MPKKTKDDSKAAKDDATLAMVIEDFDSSWKYARNNYHDTWDKVWKLWSNKRVDVAYKGVSDTFVPMVFSTVETMVAALAGGRPRFDYRPTKPEQENDTKVLNNLIDYYWDKDKWQSTIDKWVRSMLLYGTGVMYISWDIDHPTLSIVPLRDFFIDPTASEPKYARYKGRRYLTTKDDLKDFEYIDEDGETQKLYKNLDKIKAGSNGEGEELDKEEKDMTLGSTLGDEAINKQIEVIEYWTKDRVVAIANRSVVIRDDKNPHLEAAEARGRDNPEGITPFIIQRNYVDESLIYGKGEVEPIIGLQESLNDLTNQNRDAITYQLNPMWTLDPQYTDYISEIVAAPGNVYPFESGALIPVPMGNIPADAFNERLNIKNEIREVTAVDQVVKGVTSNQSATATEVVNQINQAAQRFDIKVSQIENEGFYDLAKLVLDLTQLYVTEPMAVRIIGNNQGIDWDEFNPETFQDEYEPAVSLESRIQAEDRDNAEGAKELYLAFAQDPTINQEELKRMALKKGFNLDEDEIQLLLDVSQEDNAGLDDELLEEFPADPTALPQLPPELAGLL